MIKIKVIIINGSGGVGKSTFIELCKKYYDNTYELSMVDLIKDIARKYFNWNDNMKYDRHRKFLADLKDLIENYDQYILYNYLDEEIDNCIFSSGHKESIIFINARSPKDISYLIEKYKVYEPKSLIITNPRKEKIISNHADANVNNYNYDYHIINSGSLEDFESIAETFVNMLWK